MSNEKHTNSKKNNEVRRIFEISSKILREELGLANSFFEELVIEVEEDGWKIHQADRSTVCVVDKKIPSDLFAEYEPEEDEIGVNLEQFLNFVNQFKNKVKIEIEEAEIVLSDDVKKFSQPLLSTNKGEIPNTDQLEFLSKIEIEISEFKEIVQEAGMVTDSILLTEKDGTLYATAEKNNTNFEREIGEIERIEESGVVRDRYPLDYLKKYAGSVGAEEVEIKLGNDYPMKAITENSFFIVAPRVEE